MNKTELIDAVAAQSGQSKAATAAVLAAVTEVWTTSRQREREVELLFAGNAIRQAIAGLVED